MNRVKNTIGLRRDMESDYKIGLNASGSFVMASLDADELAHLKTVNFESITWTEERYALEVKGTSKKGSIVVTAKLSNDHRYCSFPGKFRYSSPKLLRCDPESIPDFIKRIIDNLVLKIYSSKDRKEYTGILVGNRDAQYKSLVTLVDDQIKVLKVEENPPHQHPQERTRIIEENPQESVGLLDRFRSIFLS
tara:strand:+ start:120 stop:695 length:576 start_codon:yes stop_codon:yes gene_type:complete